MASGRHGCRFSQDFERIIEESVFKRLTPDTTPAQYQQAIESLTALFETFAAKAREDPFHHPTIATGIRHHCVRDSFDAAVFYLKAGALLAPAPKPAPPPAPPRPKRRSLADMLKPFAAEEGNDTTS